LHAVELDSRRFVPALAFMNLSAVRPGIKRASRGTDRKDTALLKI
jgi:hypothetical protein